MSETVSVTFAYALGQQVRWTREPQARWRVLERWYLDGAADGKVLRYLCQSANDTQRSMAEEGDLTPWEDTPSCAP